jgi:hypothetical protein
VRRNRKADQPAVFGRRRDRQSARRDGEFQDRWIEQFRKRRGFRQFAIGDPALQVGLVGGDQKFSVGERAPQRDEIGNEPAPVRRVGIVRIRRRAPRQLQSQLPLRREKLGERHRIRLVAFDAAGRVLERAQGVELRRLPVDHARRVAFRPEVAEQVVRQHGAEAVGDDDDAFVAALVELAQQFQPAFADRGAGGDICRDRLWCSGPPARTSPPPSCE